MPGPNEPQGFILTAILGIVGAFVARFLGQILGWYGPGEGADLIGAVVGAISASTPAMRANNDHLKLMREQVVSAVRTLSAEFGAHAGHAGPHVAAE